MSSIALRPRATPPGTTLKRVVAAASTNATSVKTSAGNIFNIHLQNSSAAAKFVKFYDKASAPTVGTDVPIFTIALAAGQARDITLDLSPIYFATGIAYAITNLVADTDTTVVAANDVHGFFLYL